MIAPEKKKDGDAFDVVLVHGKTDDGQGACVLRARPGKLEAGEVRPLKEGQPLSGGEVVTLTPRKGAPNAYDVKSEWAAPERVAESRAGDGPAQVATDAYRTSWERTFGSNARRRPALA